MLRLRNLTVLVVLLGVACSGGQEAVINTFLTAVQNGNEDVAESASVAEFPGEVESWEIVEVGSVSSGPFLLPELDEKLSGISAERKAQKDKNAYFVQDHKSAYDEYTAKRQEDPELEFSGEMAEFQKAWEPMLDAEKELDHEASEMLNEMSRVKTAASLSVSTGVNENYDGEVSTSHVTVRVNDGSAEKTYTFTLQKFVIVDTERNINPIGRWVITGIEERA